MNIVQQILVLLEGLLPSLQNEEDEDKVAKKAYSRRSGDDSDDEENGGKVAEEKEVSVWRCSRQQGELVL